MAATTTTTTPTTTATIPTTRRAGTITGTTPTSIVGGRPTGITRRSPGARGACTIRGGDRLSTSPAGPPTDTSATRTTGTPGAPPGAISTATGATPERPVWPVSTPTMAVPTSTAAPIPGVTSPGTGTAAPGDLPCSAHGTRRTRGFWLPTTGRSDVRPERCPVAIRVRCSHRDAYRPRVVRVWGAAHARPVPGAVSSRPTVLGFVPVMKTRVPRALLPAACGPGRIAGATTAA